MKTISYRISTHGLLSDEFSRGFERLSIETASHGRPVAVYLWHPDGTGLRIRGVMNNIQQRVEVGVLEFSEVRQSSRTANEVDLPDEFRENLSASKLLLKLEGTAVESGIILKGVRRGELTIVAGAYPCTLAVKALFLPAIPFEPEYPLSSYTEQRFIEFP